MAKIVLKGKLLKWGNSYGVRIAKADVERARIQAGAAMTVTPGEPDKVDLSGLMTFSGGDPHGSRDHDEIVYMAQLEKLLRIGSITHQKFDKEAAKIRRIIKRRRDRVGR